MLRGAVSSARDVWCVRCAVYFSGVRSLVYEWRWVDHESVLGRVLDRLLETAGMSCHVWVRERVRCARVAARRASAAGRAGRRRRLAVARPAPAVAQRRALGLPSRCTIYVKEEREVSRLRVRALCAREGTLKRRETPRTSHKRQICFCLFLDSYTARRILVSACGACPRPHAGPAPPGTNSATLLPLSRIMSSFVTRFPSAVISLQTENAQHRTHSSGNAS